MKVKKQIIQESRQYEELQHMNNYNNFEQSILKLGF